MSLKKQFDSKKHLCKVTFTLAKDIADASNRVNLAGDFNNWDIGCSSRTGPKVN